MNKILSLFIFSLFLISCSDYQKVLKSENVPEKYALAEELYKEEKYKKALNIFEQIVPKYRGKPQGERVMYYYADTYYKIGDYYLSGYQFDRFAKSYPDSDKKEEAAFKSAKSNYFLSPRFSLDQEETDMAIEKLQAFINAHPESEYIKESNDMVAELRKKKERKAYEIAKQNHHREDYKVAIATFDNYLIDYPGSPYKEKALYYKLESQYLLAIGSYENLVKERLMVAEKYYNNYKKYYSVQGELVEKANDIGTDITARLEQYK